MNDGQQIVGDARERIPFALQLVYRRQGDMFELISKFTYRAKDGRSVTARAGFFTDLGSVRGILRWVISVIDWAEAFVIHDWCCVKKKWDNGDPMTAAEWNALLKEVALYTGHSQWKVYPVYWAVCSFWKVRAWLK